MPRVAGVDIPDNKKVYYALQYVHGIGPKFAAAILLEVGIDPNTKARDLNDQQVAALASTIDANYIVEGALKRQVAQNIQRLREIRAYRGLRHRAGLPTRGQRTRCNARTRKGRKKTVAGKKGVKG